MNNGSWSLRDVTIGGPRPSLGMELLIEELVGHLHFDWGVSSDQHQ